MFETKATCEGLRFSDGTRWLVRFEVGPEFAAKMAASDASEIEAVWQTPGVRLRRTWKRAAFKPVEAAHNDACLRFEPGDREETT